MNNTTYPPPEKEPPSTTITIVFFRIVFGLIGLLALLFALCELNKAYWDYRIAEMCKKDGGLHIFESITISHDEFLAWGGQDGVPGVPIPLEDKKRIDIPIFERSELTTIHQNQPHAWRSVSEYIHINDGKVLARNIFYSRRGGDFPSPMHESHFSCPNEGLVSERVILVEGGAK